MKEIIGDFNGAKVFSKLDLNQGYDQLELAPEFRYITTFTTHMGVMPYKSLNFGISSAAEIFQNVIRETLEDIDCAINISDDILAFGKTHEEHDHNLKATNTSATTAKTSRNSLNMCSPKTAYRQTRRKLKTRSAFRASELRSLLGMTNCCSKLIPDYATMTEPLRKLTNKEQSWCWAEEHDRAVSQLKEALVTAPVTDYFDPEKDTEISVDAIPVGLAAILLQVDPKIDERHVVT